jgi:hypothetical protein
MTVNKNFIMSDNSDNESEYESSESEEEELDEETIKAREKFQQEIKETKLREARKLLFGEFAFI